MDLDLTSEPVGRDPTARTVYLGDIWPSAADVQEVITASVRGDLFRETYADVYTGDDRWRALPVPEGDEYDWDPASTYILASRRTSPSCRPKPTSPRAIEGARCLVLLGDSVTTDHISPAGSISPQSPAGRYLIEHGVERGASIVRLAPGATTR